ncbi:hypothetical protein [Plantactinospora soyae]|uniref:Uncharacterized protein n=1 Tax=Plantactinospora soyae TaxID=1544732 RepID=A0A927R4D3_9ACTN|nr:hypothetical protein [Plantactinospora soyae]MBE1486419.1 hypothetical protein [Plantactinospora soyae]
MDAWARWRADRWIERLHQGGGRCTECGRRGGCLALLAVVRRKMARSRAWG